MCTFIKYKNDAGCIVLRFNMLIPRTLAPPGLMEEYVAVVLPTLGSHEYINSEYN